MDEQQADGPGAQHNGRLPGPCLRLFKPAHDAGQGLGERGMLKGHSGRQVQRILGDDASGDADELGVGAVVEQQIVAQVLLSVAAEKAFVTGVRS